jgi:4-hydroxythreonine-4-phosphate dehydrogenase
MYHDQALIPIKTLAFDHAVNVTLGCRSCAPRPITAPPSTLPAPGASGIDRSAAARRRLAATTEARSLALPA